MEDIAPGLLSRIRSSFSSIVENNQFIQTLRRKIAAGNATYADASRYAQLVGDSLSRAFLENLGHLPDGKLYYNIASRIIQPMLEEDHAIVSDAAVTVQQHLNEKAGIFIKPQKAPLNQDRIDGIIDKVSSADRFEDVRWVLEEPVTNFSMNVVDEILRRNVEFQGRAGLSPRIIRRPTGKCCKWCQALAGSYDYPNLPQDVYRRHENCRCIVEYDPGGSKRRQNVHTKQLSVSEKDAKIEARKFIGLHVNGTQVKEISDHVVSRMTERSVLPESIRDAIEHPLKIGSVKYDKENRPSFMVIGEKATVYINPQTGVLTTTHPTHSGTARKLKAKGR